MGVSRCKLNWIKGGEPTSVDVLVGHTQVILARLLTATDPLHPVLPPLDIAFQEDPGVAEKIVLGKIRRVFSVRTCLIHPNEPLSEFDVPCPLAVEIRKDVSRGGYSG